VGDPGELVGRLTRLRAWRDDDVGAIFEACQDPDTQRFTTIPSPYRREDAAWFVAHYVHDVVREGGRAFAVVALDAPDLVGSMTLLHARPDPEHGLVGEIGYWTAPWARGRGYTSDALAVVVTWAFAARGIDRLELLVLPDNVASRAVARRAGFVEESLDPAHPMRDGSLAPVVVHARERS
jgi:RimJ/RimL family protein N-acetyltransferase